MKKCKFAAHHFDFSVVTEENRDSIIDKARKHHGDDSFLMEDDFPYGSIVVFLPELTEQTMNTVLILDEEEFKKLFEVVDEVGIDFNLG